MRRQAEQKKENEIKEKISDNQYDTRKVMGFLRSTLDKDTLHRASSKELKERKLQERLSEIAQMQL